MLQKRFLCSYIALVYLLFAFSCKDSRDLTNETNVGICRVEDPDSLLVSNFVLLLMKDSNISIDEFAKYVNVSNEEELKAYAEYYRKQLPNAKIRSLYIKSDSVISWFGDTARSLASISIKNILNGFVQEKVEIKFIGYHYEFADDDPTLYNKRRCYSLKGFNDFYVLTEEGYISDIVYKGRYLLLGEKTKLQILPK